MRYALLTFMLLIAGCTTETRSASVERTSGVQNGQPVNLLTVREERAKAETSAELGPLVNAAVSAAMGDVRGAIKGIGEQVGQLSARPAAPTEDALIKLIGAQVSKAADPDGLDPATGGIASAGAMALLLALREWAAARAHKRDADEGWDLAMKNAKPQETKA